jgi:hypothetical protein
MSNISKINLYSQKLKLTPPYFETIKKEGEDHTPIFKVSCTFENNTEIGEGTTLKSAKEDAAAKIVELGTIDHKLKDLENAIYTISYNVPLIEIWENEESKEYKLTLKKKDKNQCEYKNFKVKIIHESSA